MSTVETQPRRLRTDADIRRIKRLRAVEGLSWPEIQERTGIPYQTAHRWVMGRAKSKKLIARQRRIRQFRAEIKILRATVRRLEQRLREAAA